MNKDVLLNLWDLFDYDLTDIEDRFADFYGIIVNSLDFSFDRINYPVTEIFKYIDIVKLDYKMFILTANFFLSSDIEQCKKDRINLIKANIEKKKKYIDIEILSFIEYLKNKI